MPAIKLPRINSNYQIVNEKGQPTPFFQRLFNVELSQRLEITVSALDAAVMAIQQLQIQQQAQLDLINQALELAGLALETADGGGPNKSGSGSSLFTNNTSTFTSVVTIPLTSVSAGDLALTGTGPSAVVGTTTMTAGTQTFFEYQIVEVDGGDTVLFTGLFDVTDVTTDEPSQIFSINHPSASAIAAFFEARTSTGSISYRIDVRKLSGANMTNMRLYLFVRRSV